ncbi:MAG: hypothetical protein Q8764_02650 [Pigeon pea little leaf phytoplasma]|uniref:hypothetical protein n=1 Tax=Candidatus Phytoplasma fabacearum TaxID=2982628 RepID=UPI0027144556|nr:hypothetical protein ['Bituminaria bituminosa' little leaf phytoplasma]MDV3158413.1 hypothetical protein [Pigeon pea little leaf phytoplasma]MDO8024165.1 hypothetical protein ['Bituminaria bituminosa' little leaf phytoplasma]MDV3158915.1 hypothetical protein [Pigeon pea little leaf phytoplasma]MDV3161759.1 hypothetical protein [Pigeon pea little leaf phytoplasma]MDV3164650.1 hypothetical protein [Pigeon pea little leaf phytoplasma]
MASRMLGNLLVRFRWGLFVIDIRKTNFEIETQIIYPYILLILMKIYSSNKGAKEA